MNRTASKQNMVCLIHLKESDDDAASPATAALDYALGRGGFGLKRPRCGLGVLMDHDEVDILSGSLSKMGTSSLCTHEEMNHKSCEEPSRPAKKAKQGGMVRTSGYAELISMVLAADLKVSDETK